MGKHGKLLEKVLSGGADAAIRFDELCFLLKRLGFQCRIRGSHFIFRKAGIPDKINPQKDGPHARPYQVKQVRTIFLANGMDAQHESGGDDA
jgi:hypothetical protein